MELACDLLRALSMIHHYFTCFQHTINPLPLFGFILDGGRRIGISFWISCRN